MDAAGPRRGDGALAPLAVVGMDVELELLEADRLVRADAEQLARLVAPDHLAALPVPLPAAVPGRVHRQAHPRFAGDDGGIEAAPLGDVDRVRDQHPPAALVAAERRGDEVPDPLLAARGGDLALAAVDALGHANSEPMTAFIIAARAP